MWYGVDTKFKIGAKVIIMAGAGPGGKIKGHWVHPETNEIFIMVQQDTDPRDMSIALPIGYPPEMLLVKDYKDAT